jgi:hypothetical protein
MLKIATRTNDAVIEIVSNQGKKDKFDDKVMNIPVRISIQSRLLLNASKMKPLAPESEDCTLSPPNAQELRNSNGIHQMRADHIHWFKSLKRKPHTLV